MPRVSKVLMDIKEKLNEFEDLSVIYSQMETDDSKFREFLSIFEDVEDTRMKNKCTYTTAAVVGIVFLGLLRNEDTWVDIALFASNNQEIIEKYIDISKGIPSHDTLERVFSLISSETLENTLVGFIQKCIQTTSEILKAEGEDDVQLLAMDGKELKGAGRKYGTDEKVRNPQIMHFYNVSQGLCIRSELIESKTNEIPTAQRILAALNIRGMIVTADAMNCQKDTVTVIRNQKADYVLALKDNHGNLYKEVKEKFNKEIKKAKKNYYKMETEKNHNQVEIREFYMIKASEFVFIDEWKDLKNIVMYKKTMTNNHTDKTTVEKRYYITDLNNLELIAQSIRRHWGVENELHWHMDANMNEDANKTMNRRAANNLSIMKKSVLTFIKLMQPIFGNHSIRSTRKIFTYKYEQNLIKLFLLLDEKNLKEMIKSK